MHDAFTAQKVAIDMFVFLFDFVYKKKNVTTIIFKGCRKKKEKKRNVQTNQV